MWAGVGACEIQVQVSEMENSVMQKRKTKTVTKEVEQVISVQFFCDWCGKEFDRTVYKSRDTDIKLGYGSSYPDGGYMIGWKVEDICEDCSPKLRKLLEDNGITTKDWEVDW